jgi:SAM-dependent methyltransferase
VTLDPDAHRAASRENWERQSAGWRRRASTLAGWSAPVSRWLVEAIQPQPGYRVLELAAGTGETGLLAAELIAPGGQLISSDQAEGMLAGGRARAAELGIENVEFKVLDAEWIDLPLAHVDAVICRWGYMLVADPDAAARETRRVLRPGGRLALAVWDAIERNAWATLPQRALAVAGVPPAPPAPGTPGPFALHDPERLRSMLDDAGFQDVEIEALDFAMTAEDAEAFWGGTMDLSLMFRTAVAALPREAQDAVRAELDALVAPYADADGALRLPARTWVAAAQA